MSNLASDILPGLPTALMPGVSSPESFARLLRLRRQRFPIVHEGLEAPGALHAMDDLFGRLQNENKLHLPNLHLANSIAAFTDYSNKKTSKSAYDTYGFLFTDWGIVSQFGEEVAEIRKQHRLSADYEFSYKRLSDQRAVDAMHSLMRAVDHLPGLLLVIAVPRRVNSLFAETRSAASALLTQAGFEPTPNVVTETTLRVLHFLVYFLALLGRQGHNAFWMTDNDDIAANAKITAQLGVMFGNGLATICPGKFDKVGFATPFDPPDVDFEAMLSVPDLFAGTLSAALTQHAEGGDIRTKPGTDRILRVLCHQGVFLKKLVLEVDLVEQNRARVSEIRLNWTGPDPYNVTWVRAPR